MLIEDWRRLHSFPGNERRNEWEEMRAENRKQIAGSAELFFGERYMVEADRELKSLFSHFPRNE